MAGISNELLRLANTIEELSTFTEKLPTISQYFNDINTAVLDEVLTQEEADDIMETYKQSVSSEVDRIVSKITVESNNIAKTSVIETNDKVKNITPVISGSPVITPPPSTYVVENNTLLGQQSSLQAQFNNMLSQINNVVG